MEGGEGRVGVGGGERSDKPPGEDTGPPGPNHSTRLKGHHSGRG